MRAAHDGNATETLAQNARGNGLVLDAKNVYWTSNDGIESMPKSGGQPRRLLDANVQAIATNGLHVYWTENLPHVKRIPVEGGTAETVAGEGLETGADRRRHARLLGQLHGTWILRTFRRIAK